MRRAALLALLLGAALPDASVARDGRAPFDPLAYFAGSTTSRGVMKNGFGAEVGTVTGQTRGRRERGGATVFDQTLRMNDGEVRRRSFRLVRTSPTTVAVTGTEVVGTAVGTLEGWTLRLPSTIRSDSGNPLSELEFEQIMELQPDGRTLTNLSTVRKFGIVVRRIEERFVRSDARRGS